MIPRVNLFRRAVPQTLNRVLQCQDIRKCGVGGLTLGVAQQITGGLQINLGAVTCGVANALPTTCDIVAAALNGCSFFCNNLSQSVGQISGGNLNTVVSIGTVAGSATLTINTRSGATLPISGLSSQISQTGGGHFLVVAGNGVHIQTGSVGANSITINSGATFRVGNSRAGGNSGQTVLTTTTNNGVYELDQGTSVASWNAVVTGTGRVDKYGSGVRAIGAAGCTMSGGINVYEGGITYSANSYASSIHRLAAGTSLGHTTFATTIAGLADLNGGGGSVTATTGTLTISGAVDCSFSGTLTGSGTITKSGSMDQQFTGASSSLTSAFAVTAGSVTLGGGNSDTTSTLGNGNIAISSGASWNWNRGGAQTYTGVMSGAGVVNKNASARLTLTATHTYTGQTNVNAGKYEIGNGGTIGALASGTAIVTTAGSKTCWNRSDNNTVANTITGAGDVEVDGAGTTTFSTGPHQWTGVSRAILGVFRFSSATIASNNWESLVSNVAPTTSNSGQISLPGLAPGLAGRTINTVITETGTGISFQHVSWGLLATGTPTLKINGATVTSGVANANGTTDTLTLLTGVQVSR